MLLLLDTGMISIALPTISDHFADVPRSRLGWAASGFFLSLATLMLLAGRIADRHGRKRVFLLGLAGYAAGAAVSLRTQIAFLAFFFGMPVWFREVSGYSALEAGLAMMPVNVVATVLSVPAGRWIDQRGQRGMMTLGCVLSAGAYGIWIAFAEPTSTWAAVFLPVMTLLGITGLMAGNTPTSAALHGLPDDDLGSANAAFQVLRRFGSTVGVILTTALIGDRRGGALVDIYDWVWAVSVAGYLAGGIVAWAYPARSRR